MTTGTRASEAQRLWDQYAQLGNGRLDTAALADELEDVYRANPDLMDPAAAAKAEVRKIEKRLSPTMDDGQLSLFDAEKFIPIGEHQRVQMSKALLSDMLAWQEVDTDVHIGFTEAYQRRNRYRASRIKEWGDRSETLADVEERLT